MIPKYIIRLHTVGKFNFLAFLKKLCTHEVKNIKSIDMVEIFLMQFEPHEVTTFRDTSYFLKFCIFSKIIQVHWITYSMSKEVILWNKIGGKFNTLADI